MRVSPLQSHCVYVYERVRGHVWIVSLYIGLQAVFIIFHYSCFMHDCARRAVISSVGAEANQGVEKASKPRHVDGSNSIANVTTFSGRWNISLEESEENILWKCNRNITQNLRAVFIFRLCRQRPTVPAGIELSPCLKFLLLLFNTKPGETRCYYGKRAYQINQETNSIYFHFPGYAENPNNESPLTNLNI